MFFMVLLCCVGDRSVAANSNITYNLVDSSCHVESIFRNVDITWPVVPCNIETSCAVP